LGKSKWVKPNLKAKKNIWFDLFLPRLFRKLCRTCTWTKLKMRPNWKFDVPTVKLTVFKHLTNRIKWSSQRIKWSLRFDRSVLRILLKRKQKNIRIILVRFAAVTKSNWFDRVRSVRFVSSTVKINTSFSFDFLFWIIINDYNMKRNEN